MALSSEQFSREYTGNNSTVTPYVIDFRVDEAAHIQVSTKAGTDPAVLLTSSDFTVTEVTGGWEVRTVAAVPATSTVTVFRWVPLTQLLEFPATGKVNLRTLELQGLDRLTMQIQQIRGLIDGGGNFVAPDASSILGIAICADAAARAVLKPAYVGQLMAQLSPGTVTLWTADSTAVGDWTEYSGPWSRVFYPDGNDRAAIQAALDAAEAAGGGTVQLGYGTYTITTVDSPASGDKAAGAYGIEIPSKVTLQGMGDGTLLSIVAGGVFGVGVAISPKGMRTATADANGFGIAANDVILRDFKIAAAAQDPASGNLINLVHANRWLIERVHIAGSYYHGIEIDQSRKITFRRCRVSGAYTGISGTWVQFDYGLAGPVNRPVSITTRLVEDVLFDECIFEQRVANESASARDIEITHEGTVLQLNRVTFRNCHFTGRNQDFTSIADIAGGNTGGSVNELLFDGCTFVTTGVKAYAFYMVQNLGMTFRGIRLRNCEFTGPSAVFVVMGGNTSASYNATHAYRHEGEITGCRFLFDKTQMPTGVDINLVVANAWSSFTFADNYLEGSGNFPVAVGTTYCRLALINNNLLTRVMRNRGNWKGTGTFSVGCTGFIIDISLADQASLTQGLYVDGNSLYSESGTGWSYGIFVTTGSTAPVNRALSYSGNFSNMATTATNNVILTGTNSAGSTTSGGVGASVRSVSGNTTLTPSDYIVNCDTTAGSITVTAASVLARRSFILIKTNAANTLTCGATSVTAVGAGILVYTDGTTTFTKALN